MSDYRFPHSPDHAPESSLNGFVIVPIAGAALNPETPMQWLYRQLYEQAQQAHQPVRPRDLFAVMN